MAAGSDSRCVARAENEPRSGKRIAQRAKTRHQGKSAREEGGLRGEGRMAGNLAPAQGAVAGRDAAARKTVGDTSRTHMRALNEVPAPSDVV